jgi:hypothetical protein
MATGSADIICLAVTLIDGGGTAPLNERFERRSA